MSGAENSPAKAKVMGQRRTKAGDLAGLELLMDLGDGQPPVWLPYPHVKEHWPRACIDYLAAGMLVPPPPSQPEAQEGHTEEPPETAEEEEGFTEPEEEEAEDDGPQPPQNPPQETSQPLRRSPRLAAASASKDQDPGPRENPAAGPSGLGDPSIDELSDRRKQTLLWPEVEALLKAAPKGLSRPALLARLSQRFPFRRLRRALWTLLLGKLSCGLLSVGRGRPALARPIRLTAKYHARATADAAVLSEIRALDSHQGFTKTQLLQRLEAKTPAPTGHHLPSVSRTLRREGLWGRLSLVGGGSFPDGPYRLVH